jgi:predicted ATPase
VSLLVDTSVWSLALRRDIGSEVTQVRQLHEAVAGADTIVTIGLVLQELLDRYPFSLDAVRTLTKLAFHPKVTYLIGENGSGKSTLLEAIAVNLGFNAEGVKRPRDGFFLRTESFFNIATEIEKLDAKPSRT